MTVRLRVFLREVLAELRRARTLGLAAEAAFWLFLSLVPLAAVAGLVGARMAAGHWATFAPLVGVLPVASRALVTNELLRASSWNGGTVCSSFSFRKIARSPFRASAASLILPANLLARSVAFAMTCLA